MDIITQNMRFRQFLMKYAEKNGVAKASRKYNKSRSYIYFRLNHWDGSIESLAEKSKKPHSHPRQHTEEEIRMIRNYRRRNQELGLLPNKPKPPKRQSKPYEQMAHPGERVQIDVKVVPRKCISDPEMKLYRYTAIDEFSRLRFLYGYEEQSTYSSADFAERVIKWFKRRGITVECIQTDNGFEFTNRFSPAKKDKPTLFKSE